MPRLTATTAVAAFAAMVCGGALATERQEEPWPLYREGLVQRPPHSAERLRFRAPPSQLLQPWRCSVSDGYKPRPQMGEPCQYDPRVGSDFLQDPFASLRLMPPLRPVPAPTVPDENGSVEPVPAEPQSPLPNR